MISNPELAAPVQNNDETYEELEKLVNRTGCSYDEARRLLGLPVEDPREVLSKIALNLNSDNNPKLCSRSSQSKQRNTGYASGRDIGSEIDTAQDNLRQKLGRPLTDTEMIRVATDVHRAMY